MEPLLETLLGGVADARNANGLAIAQATIWMAFIKVFGAGLAQADRTGMAAVLEEAIGVVNARFPKDAGVSEQFLRGVIEDLRATGADAP